MYNTLHYELVVFFTFTKEVVVFWQQCQWDHKLQGFLLLQRGSIMLSFSETNFLKRFAPLYWFPCLFSHAKSKIAKAYGFDCLNCKHLPNVCKFLLGLEAQILDTAFSSGADRCESKTFSILSNTGGCTSFYSLPSSQFHHSSSITYSMFIAVKRVVSFDHSSCNYHSFTHPIINLIMWAMYSAIWVIYSNSSRWQLVNLLGSVADPDPNPDPLVFGAPGSGSGSISQRYGSGSGSGSGSFYHQAKKVRKTLIPTALWLLFDFLSLKMMYMYLKKAVSKKTFKKISFLLASWEGHWRK